MVILCAGMFRSGSTWQYQVAVELARRSGRKFQAHGMPKSNSVANFVRDGIADATIHIVKTHTPDAAIRDDLAHEQVRVLFSYRDIRDIVYSMMHKLGASFEQVTLQWHIVENTRINEVFWLLADRKVVQRYKTWIADPRPFVVEIAAVMDMTVTPEVVDEICEKFSLKSQKDETEKIEQHFRDQGVDFADPSNALRFDPVRLLHWNHIRKGRVGHWKELATPEQKQVLLRLCGDWLIKRGYETDNAWAS